MRTCSILAALCTCLFSSVAYAAISEEVFEVPVAVKDMYGKEAAQSIKVTAFRDDSRTRSPYLVINHGRPTDPANFAKMDRVRYEDLATYFVEKGFAVLVPTRLGYGVTGGLDVEYSGSCTGKVFSPGFDAAAEQIVATIRHAEKLPFVDSSKGVVLGYSYGGITSVKVSTLNVPGLKGVVNVAGGSGGSNQPGYPCRGDLIGKLYEEYGASSKVANLWLYSPNDRLWGDTLPKEWFDKFSKAGGKGKFVDLPPYMNNGHLIFTGNPDAWKPAVEEFIKQLGF